jgi:ribosomal protein S27E
VLYQKNDYSPLKGDYIEDQKNRFKECPHCKGTKKCSYCNGEGYIIKKGWFSTSDTTCKMCNGYGFCSHCGGAGKYKLDKIGESGGKFIKVKCPKCDEIIQISKEIRPLEFPCPNCGMALVLKK